MKYIKLFEIYSEGSELRRKIEHELLEYGISNYTINEDGTVDVNGDVNLGYYKLKILRFPKLDKIPFKFGKVSGSFTIRDNKITSLEGSPTSIGLIGAFFANSAAAFPAKLTAESASEAKGYLDDANLKFNMLGIWEAVGFV